jgi:hypothetical protein
VGHKNPRATADQSRLVDARLFRSIIFLSPYFSVILGVLSTGAIAVQHVTNHQPGPILIESVPSSKSLLIKSRLLPAVNQISAPVLGNAGV